MLLNVTTKSYIATFCPYEIYQEDEMNQINKINDLKYIINIFIPMPQYSYNNVADSRAQTTLNFNHRFHIADELGKY